jgi:hypothetical protein
MDGVGAVQTGRIAVRADFHLQPIKSWPQKEGSIPRHDFLFDYRLMKKTTDCRETGSWEANNVIVADLGENCKMAFPCMF